MRNNRIFVKNLRYRLLALVILSVVGVWLRYHPRPTIDRYVFYVEIPPPLETEVSDRDLTQYDFGGHVGNCEQKYKNESCFAIREEARKFIEKHFKGQRRGYVIIDGASLDLPPTAYFFVEPSGIGSWEVRVRVPIPGPYYNRLHYNMNTTYYTEVFRRRAGKGELNIWEGDSALVLRSRGVYELLL